MQLALGETPTDLVGPLVVNILIVAGSTVLAWASFRRQEL
jgi:hypothetical protein